MGGCRRGAVTCTITNKRQPQVKVVKELLPAADTGKFDLKIDATSPNGGAGYGDGGNTGFVNVGVGSHTVDEAGHGATDLADYDKSVSCGRGKGANPRGPSHTLAARLRGAGHLHDHEQAAAAGEGGQGAAAGGRSGQVRPEDRRDRTRRGRGLWGWRQHRLRERRRGSHTVDEAGHAAPTWPTTTRASAGRLEREPGGAEPHLWRLAYGEQVTCTITNKRLPQVKVVKELLPAADPGRFDLKIDATSHEGGRRLWGWRQHRLRERRRGSHDGGRGGARGTDLADYDKSACRATRAPPAGPSHTFGALTSGERSPARSRTSGSRR